jgi:hypothetical protein
LCGKKVNINKDWNDGLMADGEFPFFYFNLFLFYLLFIFISLFIL